MNNFNKETDLEVKYLDIENYIDFAFNNLNNSPIEFPSYEEVFISEKINTEYEINYENYIEEAFKEEYNKIFNNISTNEYFNLFSTVFNKQ